MRLDEVSAEQRDALLANARTRTLARGDFLYGVRDAVDAVYFVASGRVKIVRTNVNGAETIIGIRAAGEVVGDVTWLSGGSQRANAAIALEPTRVHVISPEAFGRALERDIGLARALTAGVARRLAESVHELAELSGKSVPGRLVDTLGRLASEYGVEEEGGRMRIALNLTHKDLADMIGTSRETLTKELNVLADIGLLRVAHRTVTLLQPQAFPFATARRKAATP